MAKKGRIKEALEQCGMLEQLYGAAGKGDAIRRFEEIAARFFGAFPEHDEMEFYSSPGRSEISGNHTDHQGGCVITASVDCDAVGCAASNGTDSIRLISEGYGAVEANLSDHGVHEEEFGHMKALVRGIVDRFRELGYAIGGFDAYLSSSVLPGSGLSSSASFEVWVCVALNDLFCENAVPPEGTAKIGRYAENVYFGKPCGLEDQMACAVGGITFIDFKNMDAPAVQKLPPEFTGHTLCIIDSGGDHADLTPEYAAIPNEMEQVAGFFGQEKLRGVAEVDFFAAFQTLRKKFGDRAVLRAYHFFRENERVQRQADALRANEMDAFMRLVSESGLSSYMYLQNAYPTGAVKEQSVAVALAVCGELLGGRGAFRVHGGGFAGTVQAFVPNDMLDEFRRGCVRLLGEGCCHMLKIRPVGGTAVR